MARAKHGRTKTDYTRLFENPASLFGPGTRVALFPNGQPEIWITDTAGIKGVRITRAGNGPAGFGLEIASFAGTPDLTLCADNVPDGKPVDARWLSLCQYNHDERSQAFKAWYADSANKPYPPEIGHLPVDNAEGQRIWDSLMNPAYADKLPGPKELSWSDDIEPWLAKGGVPVCNHPKYGTTELYFCDSLDCPVHGERNRTVSGFKPRA